MAGRPEKPVDWAKVDALLLAGCKGPEIAPHFDMHPTTFYGKCEEYHKMNFTAYSAIKRAQGDSILRAKQYELATKGDKMMLIWLGKNRLDQRDAPENETKSGNVYVLANSKLASGADIRATQLPIETDPGPE